MKTRTKIFLAVLAGVLYFIGCQMIQAAELCLLQDDYANFNHDYFLGQLPANVNVEWANLGLQNDMGMTWVDESGIRQIRIDRKTNPVIRQAQLTLLHEMCHIKTDGREFDVHGIKWQACMVDLAEHGAMHDLW